MALDHNDAGGTGRVNRPLVNGDLRLFLRVFGLDVIEELAKATHVRPIAVHVEHLWIETRCTRIVREQR